MAPTLVEYNQPGMAVYTFIQPYPMMPPPAQPVTPRRTDNPPLPLPSHILPSQKTDSQPCLACGKSECALASHKHFSRRILANAKKGKQAKTLDVKPPKKPMGLPATPGSRSSSISFSYSVSMDPEREHLLALWSREWSLTKRGPERHLFPRKFIDRILPAARNHAPLLQALLAYSGTLWSIANHVPAVSASAQHALAVELLSQACPTEREASTDEAMLTATLLLLIYMAQGNAFEVNKHVSGLVHLAGLRGGPHYLGLSGLVAELLIYADHTQAIFFNHEPVWQFPLPPLNMGLLPKCGKAFQNAMDAHELERSVAQAALSVCKVADILDYATNVKGLPKVALNSFGYLSTIAEYQLARCNALHHQSASLNECICLALILFNHIVLRNDGATTPCIVQVEYRFWQALEQAEGRGLRSSILPSLYMWMVITGLTVGIRGECQFRRVGVEKLRAAKINVTSKTWDQFRQSVLEEYVWLQSAQEETFKAIWLEAEGLRSDTGARTPQRVGGKGR
ncbi:hypothetical protein H2198_004948 [Neophaeococcomyces mojaviensis]|uniref:Uncharacterized protein n=1 Tax=Neophaeococcomyces mojaviensis TaxID=3383035 RepID=A0ACC3A7N9_9EURO|nr:hypothetical protein H2198_004948 [Knufia sp. JES_112]